MTRYRINPGDLRHVITFQKDTDDTWSDVLSTRAGIYPISGREFFAAENLNSEVSHKVNLRYVPGITPDMRIKYGGRIFSIISVINFQERNIELQLLCKELI